jgi:hypothetical protein
MDVDYDYRIRNQNVSTDSFTNGFTDDRNNELPVLDNLTVCRSAQIQRNT